MRRQKRGQASVSNLKYRKSSRQDSKFRIQDSRFGSFSCQLNTSFYTLSLAIFVFCFASCSQHRLVPVVKVPSVPSTIGVNHVSTIKGDFFQPGGITIDTEGKLYLADSGKNVIYVLSKDGSLMESIGRFGWQEGEFDRPTDVALDTRLRLYIADSGNSRIQKYGLIDRSFSVIIGDRGDESQSSLSLQEPQRVATDARGYIFIVYTWNNLILKTDPLGRIQMKLGGAAMFNMPQDVMVDSSNNIYVCDTGNHRICKFDFSGNQIATWGQEGSGKGQFRNPASASQDKNENVYVVDQGNHRIQIFRPDGTYLTEFGQQELKKPFDIAIDNDDHAYVTDLSSAGIEVFKIIK